MKTYAGRSLADIVPQIRDELGSGAVILKQRPIRTGGVGGFFAKTGIEVLAAESDPTAEPAPAAAAPASPRPAPASVAPAAAGATATAVAPRTQVDVQDGESREALLRETFAEALRAHVAVDEPELEEEPLLAVAGGATARVAAGAAYGGRTRPMDPVRIGATRTARGRLRIAPEPMDVAPLDDEAADLALELERAGLAPDAAEALVREVRLHVEPFAAGRLRDLARRRIASRFRVEQGWEPDGAARRIAVVGASGVGKTTAIANLAAGYTSAGLMVGIVVLDRPVNDAHPMLPRLGATAGSEADRALAYMAGADVLRVGSVAEMRRGIQRLGVRDVVVVDTPGLAVGDEPGMAHLKSLLEAAAPHETHAAVPLGIAEREAAAMLSRLARVGANRLLVTKTDEARFAGPLYGLATVYDLPFSYLGCGPRVPGDLVAADGVSIAERILPI
jgi:flagellar biosynthesis protein FlhF